MADRVLKRIEEAKPTFSNAADAVFAALHAEMLELGFRCVGVGENGVPRDDLQNMFLPDEWNSSVDSYSLRYKHVQSAMTFLLKCITMGGKLLIHALAIEDERIHNMDIKIKDFVKEGADLKNYSGLYLHLDDLLSTFKTEVLVRLVPGIKPGFEPGPVSGATTTTTTSTTTPTTITQPPPYYVPPPGYDYDEDPLRVPIPHPYAYRPPPGMPGIGDQDLYPPGLPHIPPIPGVGPGVGPWTGNVVGPGHGIFGPGINDPYYPLRPGFGLPRPLPPGAVPPGARFDPFGPPPPPQRPGLGRGALRGEPDPDHLPPPGYDNMYM